MIFSRIKEKHNLRKKKKIIKARYPNSSVNLSCFFDEKTVLEGFNVINKNVNVCSSKIGIGTIVGYGCYLKMCKIGRFSSIGPNVRVVNSTHPTSFVSTYPSFYNTSNNLPLGSGSNCFQELLFCKNGFSADIGNDVWIGTDVLIKGGVTIGDGAVIGMGSVVVKDVEPYSIVAGAPAKIVRYRFDNETIKKLLEIKWWNWDITTINDNKDKFCNLEIFLKNFYNDYGK